MNSWRAWTTATTLLISVRPRPTKESVNDGSRRKEERTLQGRTKMSVCTGIHLSLLRCGWLAKEEKKSSLFFHDGFSVGIRNPGMKGESEWIVDCLP